MHDPDSDHPRNEPAVNPLPWSVLALFLVIAAVEIVLTLGERGIAGGPAAIGWRLQVIRDYSFSAEIFDWMRAQGHWPAEHLMRFVTYAFVHGSFTSTAFACVMLLALGKWVGEVTGALSVLFGFFLAVIAGALAYGLFASDGYPLLGAFPGVYGLIGLFTWLLWARLKATGDNQFRAFGLIGVLMALQLVFGVLFGVDQTWIADVTGAITGFVAAPLLVPGGFAALLHRLRRD
ncbi:rhomboid family intramembrane serine protease [Pseudooceanicola sp.]|uniref:rhomboid family intramembrane serine protease n=1 Tax=Pseudooceanicola sp. TaxID=1914328 RepID=UPI00260D425A|nr:rhomboid family intramembrane serine protease [Pseudooceanicola sp.]MDF1856129.1 rhomboid family intramembrane serine protease [Pseudooceanicola sp.]